MKTKNIKDATIVEEIVEPVVEPEVEPVVEPVVEPIVEPVVEPVVEPEVEPVVEPIVEPVVEPVVEPEVEPEVEQEEVVRHANGIVKAKKLYVRKEADKDGDVLTIISGGTGVEINLTESTEDFYKVRVVVDAELKDGYCKKEFIDVK